jgi:NAD(P)H-nitrite reductase large subunit
VSAESTPPYSRVPLSKGILAGTEEADSALLPELPHDVDFRGGTRATHLDVSNRNLHLADGTRVHYDGLIVATGARAHRLASPGQNGEFVLRDLEDAHLLRERASRSRTAIVVGGGFLAMELASTLCGLGLEVTVVAMIQPLSAHLGDWLSSFICKQALRGGVKILTAGVPVKVVGDPVRAVDAGPHGLLAADLIVTAVGDAPNIEWLRDSGLPLAHGLVADSACLVAPSIAVAGDVAAHGQEYGVRSPHWTSAVVQGGAAARAVLGIGTSVQPDPYFWTEQFGLDVKVSGSLKLTGEPEVLEGAADSMSALLRWRQPDGRRTAVSVNHRMPIVKLKQLGARHPVPVTTD